MTISIYMIVDGVRAYDNDDDLRQGFPTILDGVEAVWGRQTVVDQPDPSTLRFALQQWITSDPDQVTLFQFLKAGSSVQVRSAESTTGRDVLVWAGDIVNASVTRVGAQVLAATVNASGPTSTLSKINVGSDPWPQESAYDRYQHILAAAQLTIRTLRPGTDWRWNIAGEMDSTIQPPMVAFRDVDAQPPTDLIQQLAESIGGIAWETADTDGPLIWVEDPTQRDGLRQFIIDPTTGKVTVGQLDPTLANVNRWTAADIDVSSLAWDQDPTQGINVVDVNWQQAAGTNDQGNPAYNQATIEVADSDAGEGIQPMTVDTQLIDDGDARRLAARWLAQAQTSEWMMSGFAIDTAILNIAATTVPDADRLSRVMDLLDIRIRVGYRITVTELPIWAPAGTEQSFYIEGGTYTWTGGRWQLQMFATSNAIGGGAHFNQFPPGVKVRDFAGLRGRDAWGAAAPNLVAMTVPFTIPARVVG